MKTSVERLPQFAGRLLVLLLAAFGLFLAAMVFSLHLSVEKSDDMSAERQRRELAQAVSNVLDDVSQAQEGVALWDMLLDELAKPKPDQAWLDENVGTLLHRLFNQDVIFILGPDDAPVYASVNGQAASPSMYLSYQAAIKRFVDLARGRISRPNNDHERLPGQAPATEATLRTTPSAVHATDLAIVQDRPAVVSAMHIDHFQMRPATPGAAPHNLLVSVRYIDGDFLYAFSRGNLVEGLHYHPERVHHDDDGERELALTSSDGAPIGYLMWRPDLPGSELWRAMLPAFVSMIGGALVIVAFLALRTYRLLRDQQSHLSALRSAHVELKASEAHAQHLAFHDVLTGLANRAYFATFVDQALVRRQPDSSCAVLLLDLDHFKQVNDTWGHAAGDALIQEFARRVKAILGPDDVIARLGGDEFAVLAQNTSEASANALTRRILAEVRAPFELLGGRAFVGASIGIAMAPRDATTRSELMRKADIALYRAKESGRNQYCFFEPEMDETLKAKALMEADLRAALADGGQLSVYFQPQIDSSTHQLVGVEALIRWHHPTQGAVPPQIFVAVAESTGLIVELGDWVLREACRAALQWPGLSIAVNLSPVQFRSTGFAARVIELVTSAGVSPTQIELEVTEGVFIEDDGRVQNAIAQLRAVGFRIALDDFGTGYSSLSYLQKFAVDKIKIDRSFVANIGEGADSTAIVNAVVTLGRSMGLTVNAEGVETAAQRDFLRAAGCDELQGFLFSKAVPAEEITQHLQMARAAD
ncbi:bifunctional diguanylate cyclase/phosphodiesterase [Achromobacter spanius]|uniref:Bifunctional diguanylate cyclase/phosphodiesterase n=1 Tax=Achromobacter spanius TaxID=217203 RepID=A0A2S5GQS7_9BURK|nr:EAL domain-containing protein [Achromobacter spanius]PPA75457.1 bifunctional diguanylate cyclase/phosphodiesterase [Achromobacter spanius]